MVGVEPEVLHGDEKMRFVQGLFELFTRDADVRYVEAVLCEFGTDDDKAPMPVGRYEAFGATLREETSVL